MNQNTLHTLCDKYDTLDPITEVTKEMVRLDGSRLSHPLKVKQRQVERKELMSGKYARQAYIEKLVATKERLRKKLAEKISP